MKYIYKITNSLSVLALIPVLLFLPMFRFIAVVEASSDNQLISLIGGLLDINAIIEKATGINIENLPEFYTIKEAWEMFAGDGANEAFTQIDASVLPETAVKFFSAAGILFAVALLFAVLVLIFGLFTKKRIFTAIFSALGFGCTFAANKCFTHIADQLVSGKISVTEILSKIESLENYATYIDLINFDIRIFELDSAYTMMLVVFGALIFLNLGFKLAESATDLK